MGSEPSKPSPPPPKLTCEPWRKVKGWDKSQRRELEEQVAKLAPVTTDEVEVPFFNILLTGQIGAGKSSFFNSLNNIFKGHVVAEKAGIGEAATSLTKEFRIYELQSQLTPNRRLAWRICDTMGLEDSTTTQLDVGNILKAVDGHVPDRHVFTLGVDFNHESQGYIDNPTLAEKAHCVAVVIDGSKVSVMREGMWNKLRTLREGLISRNIPSFILLSHIDEACSEVEKDVKLVYRSIKVRDTVSLVGKRLLGLPENQVFPIKNYKTEMDLDDDMDIILLYPIRQMLYSCQGHIENKM